MYNAYHLAKLRELNQARTAQLNEEFRRQQQAHIWEGRNVGGRAEIVPKSCPHCGVQGLWRIGPRDYQGVPSYQIPIGEVFVPPSF